MHDLPADDGCQRTIEIDEKREQPGILAVLEISLPVPGAGFNMTSYGMQAQLQRPFKTQVPTSSDQRQLDALC